MANMLIWTSGWHVSIPARDVIRNTNLSASARFLWCVLASYASEDRRNPFPSRMTLMRVVGCGKNALSRYLRELELFGFLRREQQRAAGGVWKHNVYVLGVPDSPKEGHDSENQGGNADELSPISPCPPLRCPVERAPANGPTNHIQSGSITSSSGPRALSASGLAEGLCPPASPAGGEGPPPDPQPSPPPNGKPESFYRMTAFLECWKTNWEIMFGGPPRFTKKDLKAAVELVEEQKTRTPEELALIAVLAWSLEPVENAKGHVTNFYCAKHARSIAGFFQYFDQISAQELGWRGAPSDFREARDELKKWSAMREKTVVKA